MCTSPASVMCFRLNGSDKYSTRYFPNMTHDEAVRAGLDIDVLTALGSPDVADAKWSTVPCGQCRECRISRSRAWANRCLVEANEYPRNGDIGYNWFLTLTVAPEHEARFRNSRVQLPAVLGDERIADLTFRFQDKLSLDVAPSGKRDVLQTFFDTLRSNYKQTRKHIGIRFFACGEYGDIGARPHYHAIVFNLPIRNSELKPFYKSNLGHQFYIVDHLQQLWPYGWVDVAEATWETMAYTARYVTKKINGKASLDAYGDLKPPFLRSSRRPGIGFAGYKGISTYLEGVFDDDSFVDLTDVESGNPIGILDTSSGEVLEAKDFIKDRVSDKVYFKSAPSTIDSYFKPPRLYDKHFEVEHPAIMDAIRKFRVARAEISQGNLMQLLSMSEREYFEARADSLEQQNLGYYRHIELNF